jgi:hypothetical protein
MRAGRRTPSPRSPQWVFEDLLMKTKNPVADGEKVTKVVANDPDDLKGTLKHVGGSQSDHWNGVIANQTVQTLWLKHSDKEQAISSSVRPWPGWLASDRKMSLKE